MEPRPQRPSRATGPYINTGTPSPSSGNQSGYGTGAFDASSAPPAPPPAIGYDPDYSPGQPLTPLKGPRGANIVGPLLAVAALAIIVAAAAFIVSQFRDDGGNGNNNSAQQTVVAASNGSPDDDDDASTEVADEDQPTAETGDDDNGQPTEESASGQDDENAEATSTPRVNRTTETGDLGASDPEDEGDQADDEESAEKTRARQWLPTASGIGEGFEQTENGSRGIEEVAASFPAEQVETVGVALTELGWQENVFRNFESATAAEDGVYAVSVSVHRFDSERGAKDGLDVFAEGGKVGGGLTEVDAAEMGEDSIVLQGTTEGGNIYVVYVRQGDFVFRIGGLSRSGDPAEFTTEIANQIIEP